MSKVDEFFAGIIIGAVFGGLIVSLIYTNEIQDVRNEWSSYIDCVQQEKASVEYCTDVFDAPTGE